MNIELQTKATRQVRELVELSDAYMNSLYPAESNHLVDIDRMFAETFEFYVMKDETACVGCIGISLRGENPELKRMFVKDGYRGRSYGRRLLAFAIDRCRQLGCAKIQLETGIHQPEAIGLYETCGFRKIPPFGSYKEDPLSAFYELSCR
jgi:putative acetyltransferase